MNNEFSLENYNMQKQEILQKLKPLLNDLDIPLEDHAISCFEVKKWKYALHKPTSPTMSYDSLSSPENNVNIS